MQALRAAPLSLEHALFLHLAERLDPQTAMMNYLYEQIFLTFDEEELDALVEALNASIGYDLYVANQPISTCQSEGERRGYMAAIACGPGALFTPAQQAASDKANAILRRYQGRHSYR